MPGELKDSPNRDVVRWQSPSFVGPFEFAMKAVESIAFPPPAGETRPSGAFCFELEGGDVLFGSLVGLDEKQADVDVSHWGRLTIDRDKIRRMSAWHDGADLIYMGPTGLSGWQEPGSSRGWREESGQVATDKEGVSLWADLKLPARAAIEFELSWKTKLDFLLALGVDSDAKTIQQPDLAEKTIRQAARFEVWEKDLVVVRETKRAADVASLQELAAGAGQVHFQVYLDQEKGRIVVASTAGKVLADLQVDPAGPETHAGACLINKHGDVRLERLRVSRWNGAIPTEGVAEKSRVDRVDGSILSGRIERFDPASREFVVKDGEQETRVAVDQIGSLSFSRATTDSPRSVRVVYQDGTRISGDLSGVKQGDVWMLVPGISKPLACRQPALRSVVALNIAPRPPVAKEEGLGRLEIEGVLLKGRLSEGGQAVDGGSLSWQPEGSTLASTLRPSASGRIVYKDPPPPQAVQQQQPQGGVLINILGALGGNAPPKKKASTRSLHLRTGDVLPCEITSIDEAGVTFKSSISDSTFVAHDKIKIVELADDFPSALKLNKSKRERLLTLPRVQKDSPPTQMIRSKNGDYLRGRVMKMDEKTLQVEVRLDTKEVPRDRISRIIWLHADELDPAKIPPRPAETTRVQAVRADGIRLTFKPERFEASTLSGTSEVLGACRVRISEVEQLLIGTSIEQEAAKLAAQQWKLKNATEPKVASGEGGESSRGTEGELVGKPAPDFELALLGGKKFHLAESKGRVVILDFWATWCGPCLQAMPQVERVAREFEDRNVLLVAVNLQEEPDQIKAMMERHKLHPTVALDRDGVAAARYGANAIPQTVIINREGVVARLFVGGGPHFDDQLREALQAVLKADAARNPELPRNPFAPL